MPNLPGNPHVDLRFLLLSIAISSTAHAEPTVRSIFSDHMVGFLSVRATACPACRELDAALGMTKMAQAEQVDEQGD